MNEAVPSELEREVEAFTVPLRMGSGFDQRAYAGLCAVLRRCAEEWRSQEAIPKRAANIFLDLSPSVEAASTFYRDAVAKRVHSAAMELDTLVRACVAV